MHDAGLRWVAEFVALREILQRRRDAAQRREERNAKP